ncbi:ribosomal RNA small subunit methyltransferase G [Rubrobacter xylanophilus]|uniref:Ribosomal RNA small subunit methyltransferase G n=1 Tax=Rubrobacter xylanophilus TaxID=49319 RepID=A0A510HP87_9ACTN|nr:16S rRNA (guanine(527)-N(7))-methyltransferase RsmG [Rubrobacter xylanophilus]BBL80527.1 ribosomal RNA small subunit methyltransferase G [Rubrobacter xylanophilus]
MGDRVFHVKHEVRNRVVRQLEGWGVEVSGEQLRLLERYALLLARYERANVIGTRDVEEILREHVLDSLSCLLFGPLLRARRIVDVGSGGGLPGIPLKILLSGAEMVLVEATGKKARFMEHAVRQLGLRGTRVVNARVEEVGRELEQRAAYDVALARAVAALPVLAEYCVPLVRVGGHVLAMKGRISGEELHAGGAAAGRLGARVSGVLEVSRLPEVSEAKQRRIVILEKTEETSERYPRKVGIPAKRPLAG